MKSCCLYSKGKNFRANHNLKRFVSAGVLLLFI